MRFWGSNFRGCAWYLCMEGYVASTGGPSDLCPKHRVYLRLGLGRAIVTKKYCNDSKQSNNSTCSSVNKYYHT